MKTEVLKDSETDSEILNDTDWLIDADSKVEIDSLVETEVLNDPETDSEILNDTDWLSNSD